MFISTIFQGEIQLNFWTVVGLQQTAVSLELVIASKYGSMTIPYFVIPLIHAPHVFHCKWLFKTYVLKI